MARSTAFPRIGLTSYRSRAAWGVWDESTDLLPASYTDEVALGGGVALLLPPADPAAADVVLDGLHGLVLSGGPDVAPDRYGAATDSHTGPPHVERDGWEIALAMAALERGMPLLGVCRGMQVLTVALGGTLCQHLPDAVGTDVHCPTLGGYGRHPVRLAEGSRLAHLLGASIEVSTHHHQSVDQLPASVVATGWAPDGTVEALEVVGDSWANAVQWHPEVHDGARLFGAFIAACAEWRDDPRRVAA